MAILTTPPKPTDPAMDAQKQQNAECIKRTHAMVRAQLARGARGVGIMDHTGAAFLSLETLETGDMLPPAEGAKLAAFVRADHLSHTFVILKLPRETTYECHVLQLACPESVRNSFRECTEAKALESWSPEEEEKESSGP